MPSPKQDTYSTVVHPGNYKLVRNWVPGETVVPFQAVQSSQALKCPATVVNPPSTSGVRPMSPWFKQWFRSYLRPSKFDITVVSGGRYVSKYTFDTPVYAGVGVNTSNPSTAWDVLQRWHPFSPAMQFYADNAARTLTLNKLGQKKWDLGVTALELRQTAGMVTDLATGMVKTVQGLINSRRAVQKQVDSFFQRVRKHGSFDKAAAEVGMTDIGLLDYLKDSWMQYQFGIRPALKDVDDAVNWLSSQQQAGVPMIVRAKAGYERRDIRIGADNSYLSLYRCRPRYIESCSVHYSVAYEVPTGQVRAITSLGLDNPYSVAWEVTRLSWMVDYVVGIGDWLQSFTATNGMVFREGCRSTLRRLTATELITELSPSSDVVTWGKRPNTSGFYLERGDFNREVLNSGLLPAVVPQIKSTLGLTQLGNSLFALSNVFSGRKAPR